MMQSVAQVAYKEHHSLEVLDLDSSGNLELFRISRFRARPQERSNGEQFVPEQSLQPNRAAASLAEFQLLAPLDCCEIETARAHRLRHGRARSTAPPHVDLCL